MPRTHRAPAVVLASALAPLAAAPAGAEDGRTEISQARALAGGVTSGDAAGFPVWITTPGSYVLTSDLVPGPGNVAIEIRNGPITLDLNGFALRGPGIGTGAASGIASNLQSAQRSTIRNGVVRGFRGRGIDLPTVAGIHLDGLLVLGNAQGGIALGEHGLVTRTRVLGNGVFGMALGPTTGYAECTIGDMTSGVTVDRGVSLGQNLCDDRRCGPRPRPRRYYLTQFGVVGSQALTACQPGFHMASLFEIWDPSGLSYDTGLGAVFPDSGPGPPQGASTITTSRGWVRTGWFDGGDTIGSDGAGWANCLSWTSASASVRGTTITPVGGDWGRFDSAPRPPGGIDPWEAISLPCDDTQPVWCVEDLP